MSEIVAGRRSALTATRSSPGPDQAKPARFRSDIEGLRAVAVLSVLAYHLHLPGFAGDFIGVDIFFVISGYLITGHLVAEVERNGRVHFGEFYARRIRRILPAATVVIVATVIAARFLQKPLDFAAMTGRDARSSALFYSNIRFNAESTDYLAEAGGLSVFQQFWSLSVEEQFYVLWPVLVAAVAGLAVRTRWRSDGQFVGPLRVALGLTVVASFALSAFATSSEPIAAFYLLPFRFWELGLGALLALSATWLGRVSQRFARPLALLGLAAIALAGAAFDRYTAWPGVAAAVPVLGTAAVITAGLRDAGSITTRFLETHPMQVVGRYSYSIYLWHWPLVVLVAERRGYDFISLVVVCTLTLVLSVSSYWFVEQPVRKSRWLAARTGRSLYFGLVLVAAGVLASIIPSVFTVGLDSGLATGATTHVTGSPITPTEFVPPDLDPPLRLGTSAADPNAERNIDCSELGQCSYGNPDSDVTVVLFGDSHAGHWAPALAVAAGSEGWRLERLTRGGCGTYKTDARCSDWIEQRWKDIDAMHPDVLVLGNRYNHDLANAELMRQVVARAPEGIAVILLSETPESEENVPECLAENLERVRSCEPNWPHPDTAAVNVRLAEIASTSDVEFLDLTSIMCNSDRCPAIAGNVLVYRDRGHVTTRFAETRGNDLGSLLTGLAFQ